MNIGEARGTYSTLLRDYNMQKFQLAKQKEVVQQKMKSTENGAELYADEAAKLELSYNAVSERQSQYQDYMNQLSEQWASIFNSVAEKQNAEAEEEAFKDLSKIMTVVRRLMKGDIVPQSDEKKVMEYDSDLYQMAKSAQMMAQLQKKKHKKHDSLWEDEEKKEREDPAEVADSKEAFANGPEVVSVEETMAQTGGGDSNPSTE